MRSDWPVLALLLGVVILGSGHHESTPEDSVAMDRVQVDRYRRVENAPQTFAGHPCTDDCSGHRAGYEWAEEHDIDDADKCTGNSQSFVEGCRAFAEGLNADDG
jgi:hypothetical protein